MKSLHSFFRAAAAVAALAVAAGCSPNKDQQPPAPKVAAQPELPKPPAEAAKPARTAAAPAMAATATALPSLGLAPTWSVRDLNGNVLGSEQLKGKVVVVDFWATWCGPCRAEIPGYVELVKKYGKEGLVIVGVSLDDPDQLALVKSFTQRFGINYPIAMGDDAVQAAFGGIEAMPTTILIDRAGQIRDKKIGALEAAEYERRVLAVLRG